VDKKGDASDSDALVAREAFNALIPMLAPFAPHISEELWESFGHSESLSRAQWPEFNAELARDEEIEVAIQVNGKLRSRIFANANASDAELRDAALADEKVKAAIEGGVVARIITVPRKLVNVVLK
jgi:leucyl-tRNA synthetase